MYDSENSDIARARRLRAALFQTRDATPACLLAATRLAESAGNITRAQQIIADACQRCPDSEKLWLEAARLHVRLAILNLRVAFLQRL